jgi:ribosomal-protein-alanine N-acetyltransferase
VELMGTTRTTRADITSMRPADIEEVMEIERHAFTAPWSRDIFLEELDREWAYVDVLRVGGSDERRGKIVGFVNYWLVRDEVHVLNVATRPEARRSGHAARLIEHCIAFAHRQKCRYLTLEVRRS